MTESRPARAWRPRSRRSADARRTGVVVAVPVASQSAAITLRDDVDEVVCLAAPEYFGGVGEFYRDFHQLSDSEVVDLLAEYASSAVVAPDAADGDPGV
jgi:putative phosphoribosyl transferase